MTEPWKTAEILTDKKGNPIPQIWDSDKEDFVPAEGKVQLTGSKMELYGKVIGDRPEANKVPVGATFTIVSTEQTWMSDGIGWEEK